MKLHILNLRALCFINLHVILLSSVSLLRLRPTCTIAAAPINETGRLALFRFIELIADDPHNILSSWNDSINFCSSAAGRGLHVAISIKELQPWTYKAMLYVDPYHLSLASSAFLGWLISKTTSCTAKFHKRLLICSDCRISFLAITRLRGRSRATSPIVLTSESWTSQRMNLLGTFLLNLAS
jgi:hypothetical protein